MPTETLRRLLFSMLRTRRIEEAIAAEYPKKQMKCPVHLSVGQEATAAAIGVLLEKSDSLFSNHRCHAHYLSKGGDLGRMVAELHGRTNGCAKGKGGSMHLVDTSVGMMGASALVAGNIPLAAGMALSHKQRGSEAIAVAFLGDGAAEEGILYETLNFAALHHLPLILICENNGYATYSALAQRQANQQIFSKAAAFGVTSRQLDGNNAELLITEFAEAVKGAREGKGPYFFECLTYRWLDHVGPNEDFTLGYRSKTEGELWKSRCPIQQLKQSLLARGVISEEEWQAHEEEVQNEWETALAFALAGGYGGESSVSEDVYA